MRCLRSWAYLAPPPVSGWSQHSSRATLFGKLNKSNDLNEMTSEALAGRALSVANAIVFVVLLLFPHIIMRDATSSVILVPAACGVGLGLIPAATGSGGRLAGPRNAAIVIAALCCLAFALLTWASR